MLLVLGELLNGEEQCRLVRRETVFYTFALLSMVSDYAVSDYAVMVAVVVNATCCDGLMSIDTSKRPVIAQYANVTMNASTVVVGGTLSRRPAMGRPISTNMVFC